MPSKTNRLEVRVAPHDREQISAAAHEANESVSDFVRKAALPSTSPNIIESMNSIAAWTV